MTCSRIALYLFLSCIGLQCTNKSDCSVEFSSLHAFPIKVPTKQINKKNGKLINKSPLKDTYTPSDFSNFSFPYIDSNFIVALNHQSKLLKLRDQKEIQKFGDIQISLADLEATIDILKLWQGTSTNGLENHLAVFQLKGKDTKGNVYFTGYYTPELKAKKKKDTKFKYPIYAFPEEWKDSLPSRKEIDGDKVLMGKGLELAYVQHLEDIYYMQLQGSGLVRFANEKSSTFFGFAGTNRHPYQSIGQYIKDNEAIPLKNISMSGIKKYLNTYPEMVDSILFKNPSYVFFKALSSVPKGAGHVPLTEDYSIAVDIDHLPLGSCLMAALPVLDKKGKFLHHQFQYMLAQDVGGAIRGNGHVDVYCGIGEKGKEKAMALHHYGQLWLLLPKPSQEKAANMILSQQ